MKAINLALITVAQVMSLALWFAGTAAGPAMLHEAPDLAPWLQAWLTAAVQLGFVAGTLVSAGLALADRFDPRRVFAASAILGAAANTVILTAPIGSPLAIAMRVFTGMMLAGVYPVGMKLAAGWANRGDNGFVVGLLVGGLTIGSASPHLVNALGGLNWRAALAAASVSAGIGAVLIGFVTPGPRAAPVAPFQPAAALQLLRHPSMRLVTLGYLGHMWELYAMWAWIGSFLAASFAVWRGAPGPLDQAASLATFAVIAVGAVGCVGAGLLADRIGRVPVTVAAMTVSGLCCLLAGAVFGLHPLVTTLFCMVWGFAIVADSAQFSAAIADFAEPRLLGTMLTVQTCLGFGLTLVTIQLVPSVLRQAGWGAAFAILAAGPVVGCYAMLRLGLRAGPRRRRHYTDPTSPPSATAESAAPTAAPRTWSIQANP